jgi:hypothetical protein
MFINIVIMEKFTKKEKFVMKAKKLYEDKYDYSLVEYIDSKTKVKIICKEHGVFEQEPREHLRGRIKCKLCSKYTTNTLELINKCVKTHGNRYDYSLVEYIDSKTKVKIICKEHGIFEQLPTNHMKGQGCPICSKLITKPKDNLIGFIKKSRNTHGNKYDYSLVEYIDSKTKIEIICKEHGVFKQLPSKHLYGNGCPICSTNDRKISLTKTAEEFILDSKLTHGEKYDYSLVEYINSQTKVKIICPEHGVFEQLPYDHISNHGCIMCTSSVSGMEKEINNFLFENNIKTITSSTSIIKPNQLDIFVPSHNIAIEFNGLYWHNELKVDKNYHLRKTELCESKGIKLIHIFEDEWLDKKEIVKSRLMNLFGLTKNKIFARRCTIKEVSNNISRNFLNENHIQGKINSKINIGLFLNEELVSLMVFTRPRLGIGKFYDGYELSRFCNKLNTIVIGGADRLLKFFIKKYSPKEIVSYADRRWSQGDLYEKLKFEKISINQPTYWYVKNKKRYHRFNFRKEILKKQGFDITNKTEHKIMLERQIYRIYDCGTIVYKKIL